jgi:mannose-6-phosphate isomerase-like protein (cupin superfamily)
MEIIRELRLHEESTMNVVSPLSPAIASTIPADDLSRNLTLARPLTDRGLCHLCLAGDTYTILLNGKDTAGRYCLIDMQVPHGGGPPPHRHDFEEMFAVQEGEIEVTFRDATSLVRAGETVNIPANAPHCFRNTAAKTPHLLCMCAPAGQDDYFKAVGDPVPDRTSPPPMLTATQQQERKAKAHDLAATYRTEFLKP